MLGGLVVVVVFVAGTDAESLLHEDHNTPRPAPPSGAPPPVSPAFPDGERAEESTTTTTNGFSLVCRD
ncbi:hypothetical protein O3P69_016249 [Scylla paramamosain]|uniref:Secreted protein n=1 Tax=Scylla paramamosain TaxID=85552 RepID=A0AAW0S9D5_SCYPA